MRYIKTPVNKDNNGIYVLNYRSSFHYSDGDREEKYLLNIVKNAHDITSMSSELERYIKDWPSNYHLSKKRANAYRTLNIDKSLRILEIGCGCGAITRYLGETGAEVLALEGSYRRAQITRERTRDQNNVSVVCAPFDRVDLESVFDLIICNGVLEYSPYFVDSNSPFDTFLSRCSNALASGGAIAVAIENQFGLRYFSSGKEEHTGIRFDGLEGYPGRTVSARTFDRETLRRLLEKHIGDTRVLIPIPDYKLPRALISEELCDIVNCGDLFADLQYYDFGSAVRPSMHERLVYQELGKSSLICQMANSFFMLAGASADSLTNVGWLGSLYKNRTDAAAPQKIDFILNEHGAVKVCDSKQITRNLNTLHINQKLENGCDWIAGESVHTAISRALRSKSTSSALSRMARAIDLWWAALPKDSIENSRSIQHNHVDAIWRNAKINDGEVRFFDQEFHSKDAVSQEWFIYRTVMQFLLLERPFIRLWNRSLTSEPMFCFLKRVSKTVGVDMSIADIARAIEAEKKFQNSVSGIQLEKWKMFLVLLVPLRIYSNLPAWKQFGVRAQKKLSRIYRGIFYGRG